MRLILQSILNASTSINALNHHISQTSTMHKQPRCSVLMMLPSELQSKKNSCHNACKRIAHHYHSAIFLVRFYVYRRSQPPPFTNINHAQTTTLQRFNDASIRIAIEEKLMSQCMQTYCTPLPNNFYMRRILHSF